MSYSVGSKDDLWITIVKACDSYVIVNFARKISHLGISQ
jgi:hypothetical protein